MGPALAANLRARVPKGGVDIAAEVEYFDASTGSVLIHFDSCNAKALLGGPYTDETESILLKNSRSWKTAVVTLKRARFAGRQNAGADLRIVLPNTEVFVGTVRLAKASHTRHYSA